MPRAGLTRARVVEEGARVADDVGWDRLSLAAVAERSGVRLPSLYKHIASLEGLRGDIRARATEELGAVMADAVLGRAGSDAVLAMADAYRDYATRHPGRYAATIAAPDPANEGHVAAASSVLRVVEAALSGYGLVGDDAVDAARALRAALHGFVDLEAKGGFGLPTDVERSFRRLVRGIDATMRGWTAADG